MSNHPSDSELADMGDAGIDEEEYRLAKTDFTRPEIKLPIEAEEAIQRLDEERHAPPPLQRYQFTIRSMLILTAVVAFLMGFIVSIQRGLPVFWIYSFCFLAMTVAWFAVGLWKMGYWKAREVEAEEIPPGKTGKITPDESKATPARYSIVDWFLMVSVVAFLLSLCSFLPGEHKLVNAAGFSGLCILVGLIWMFMAEHRHPKIVAFWWIMFFMYLLTSSAVMVMG
jgi:hypothetical protein